MSDSPLHGLDWRHGAIPVGMLIGAGVFVSVLAGPVATSLWIMQIVPVIGLTIAVWALVAMVPLVQSGGRGSRVVIAVAVLYSLNILILTLPRTGPFAALDWNWQGKTLDLIWCLALIAILTPEQRKEIGWTWRVDSGTLGPALINIAIIAIVGFFALGANVPGTGNSALTLERVLFDTTHPNLVEEIVFRGFMLALLDRAFAPRWTIAGAKIGWGLVLTAWLFGLVHGITPGADGGIAFDPSYLAFTFVAGLMFGWIRALTGSLWPAFLAHCAPEVGILLALAML